MTNYLTNGWCNLCYCNTYSTHYTHNIGKKHKKLYDKFKKIFSIIPDVLKFRIMSFLNYNIIDVRSLFKEIHAYNLNQCLYEIYMYSTNSNVCNICKSPRDIFSYDDFKKHMSKHEMCIHCIFHLVTSSNFINGLSLAINENKIKLISEDVYQNVNIFYRFDRIAEMLRILQLFYNRNSFEVPIFDLSLLSSFWSIEEFLSYLYYISCNNLNVINLYSIQQL